MTYFERFKGLEEAIKYRERRGRGSLIDNTPKKRFAHYPSSLRACKRQLVQDWLGIAEDPPDFNSQITFGFGHAFEEVVVKEFKEMNFYKGDEESFKLHDSRLEHPFSGRVDLLIQLEPDLDPQQLMRPVELKTTSNGQFEDNEYGGYGNRKPIVFDGVKNKPKFYHVDQLTVYLKKMNLDWGVLIYANKDNSDFRIFKIYYDHKVYDAIVDYCRDVEDLVKKARETGELPQGNTVEDDGSTSPINGVALTVYKRGEKTGLPKLDKQNKSAGIVKFPCVWENSTSGKISTCRFFERCHGEVLKDLGLTMEDLRKAGD